ncbi:MAG: sugar dehydrogenase complex small subunit [Pseudomonadota bacterium]
MLRGPRGSRRSVLLSGAAAAVLLGAGAGSSTAATGFERFMALSRRLTGRASLDPLVGRQFYGALVGSQKSAALPTLLDADGTEPIGPAGTELERRIVEQWYTGVYQGGGALRRATYQGALMWPAMDLPAAPGVCQGELGFWSLPPAP